MSLPHCGDSQRGQWPRRHRLDVLLQLLLSAACVRPGAGTGGVNRHPKSRITCSVCSASSRKSLSSRPAAEGGAARAILSCRGLRALAQGDLVKTGAGGPSRVGPPTPEVDPRAPEVGPQPQRAHHDHFCHPISFPCTHPSAHSRHLKTAHIGPLAWKNSLPPWRHRLSASCFVKSVTPNPDLATYSPTVFMAAITMALKTPFCSFPCMSDTSTRVLKGASVLFIFCVLGPWHTESLSQCELDERETHSWAAAIRRKVLVGNVPTGKSCLEDRKVQDKGITVLVQREIIARKGRQMCNIFIHNQFKECFKDMPTQDF